MDAVLGPVKAHQLDDLEPLLKMEILLSGHHIDAFVKIVMLLAVDGGGDISCDIQGRAVLFTDQGRAHAPLGQIHDFRSLRRL